VLCRRLGGGVQIAYARLETRRSIVGIYIYIYIYISLRRS
jgi:hypothetical protein